MRVKILLSLLLGLAGLGCVHRIQPTAPFSGTVVVEEPTLLILRDDAKSTPGKDVLVVIGNDINYAQQKAGCGKDAVCTAEMRAKLWVIEKHRK